MERVTVADLKAKLSYYLREVREGGSFTVVSHGIPVAVLGPLVADDADDFQIIAPSDDPARWGDVDVPPLSLSRDIVDYLTADRDERDLGLGPPKKVGE